MSSYLYVAVSNKRAAVLKLLHRSHKSNIIGQESATPPDRELFTKRISGVFDLGFL